jgi:hypothetical protein
MLYFAVSIAMQTRPQAQAQLEHILLFLHEDGLRQLAFAPPHRA